MTVVGINLIFTEIALIIVTATVLGYIFQKLKQPPLLGFIFAGIFIALAGLYFQNPIYDINNAKEIVEVFSEIGIAFLLFLVGINLDLRVLKDIGKLSFAAGIGQIILTAVLGTGFAYFIGFDLIASLYIGIALTFSSTVIVVKLLSDRNELNSLHAKIAIGVLIIQDFAAVLVLIFISSFSGSVNLTSQLVNFVLSIVAMFLLIFILMKFVINKLFDRLAKSQEILFIGSIAWCFALAAIALKIGFSKEIGAFVAGITLASLPYTFDIAGKLRYLRDFFIVLFFVILGTKAVIATDELKLIILPSIILSLFVLIFGSFIVYFLARKFGYKPRTAFLSAISLSQISEFSLIMVALGASVGHIQNSIVSIITIVAVITVAVSSYMVSFGNQLYEILADKLGFLSLTGKEEEQMSFYKKESYDLIFLGFNRTGRSIFSSLNLKKEKALIVDFDPQIITSLIDDNFHCLFGDVADLETLNLIVEKKPKILISTILDFDANLFLLRKLGKLNKEIETIILAQNLHQAKLLYEQDADLVIVPPLVAGKFIGQIINEVIQNKTKLAKIKKKLEKEIEKNKLHKHFGKNTKTPKTIHI